MRDSKTDAKLMEIENKVIAHSGTRFSAVKYWCCSCFRRRWRRVQTPVVLEEVKTTKQILVLDLDETLVHCSFHQPPHFDATVPIEIEGATFDVFVQKPSLAQYANPIIDLICPGLPTSQRMFRESCTFHEGLLVKDLTIFEAPLEKVIIVDNNPCSFMMHPENAILSVTWEGEQDDSELMDYILPVLQKCIKADDVRPILAANKK